MRSHTSSRWWTLAVLSLVAFVMAVDALVVAVALPSIQRDLGFAQADLQWVVSAFGLTFGGFLLLSGRMGDLLGRRRLLLVGLVLFALASLAGGVAQSPLVLIAARAAQGLSAALSTPAILALVASIFLDEHERNRAIGIESAIGSLGVVAGAILGGLVTEWIGWRWVFLLNVPAGLALVPAVLTLVPESRDEAAPRRLDLTGAATATTGIGALLYSTVELQQGGPKPGTIVAFTVSLALLGTFVLAELRSDAPLVRFGFFRLPSVAGANLGSFAVSGGYASVLFLGTLLLQQGRGYSPLETGLALLPFAAIIVIASPLAGWLANRIGLRAAAVIGLGLSAAGMALLSQASVEGSYAADVLPGTLLAGIGAPVGYVPITVAAVAGVGEREHGLASGLYNTSAQIGGAIVVAALATVLAAAGEGASDRADFEAAFLAGAAFLLTAAAAVCLLIGKPEKPAADRFSATV